MSVGSNWFSITDALAKYIVAMEKTIVPFYHFTLCCDEVFLQTIVKNSPFYNKLYINDNHSNIRYVDWKRGSSYVFLFLILMI